MWAMVATRVSVGGGLGVGGTELPSKAAATAEAHRGHPPPETCGRDIGGTPTRRRPDDDDDYGRLSLALASAADVPSGILALGAAVLPPHRRRAQEEAETMRRFPFLRDPRAWPMVAAPRAAGAISLEALHSAVAAPFVSSATLRAMRHRQRRAMAEPIGFGIRSPRSPPNMECVRPVM